MEKEQYRKIKTIVSVPYELAEGPTLYRFFEGLRQEKILATKCKKCGRVLVPARTFCPRCFEDMEEWVEVAQEGTIETWCLVNYKYFGVSDDEVPYIAGFVRLDGTDCEFMHKIGGIDMSDPDKVAEKVKVGGRVKAVWSKEKHGDIFDMAHFKLVG